MTGVTYLNVSLSKIPLLGNTPAISESFGFLLKLITDYSTVTVYDYQVNWIWLPLGPFPLLEPSATELSAPVTILLKELKKIRERLLLL